MATIKGYTNIEQSRKLAEILPPKSADMYYHNRVDIPDNYPLPVEWKHNNPLLSQEIPCWSLAALLAVIPIEHSLHGYLTENGMVYRVETLYAGNSKNYDNPVDACVDMIVKLHEQNLL